MLLVGRTGSQDILAFLGTGSRLVYFYRNDKNVDLAVISEDLFDVYKENHWPARDDPLQWFTPPHLQEEHRKH